MDVVRSEKVLSEWARLKLTMSSVQAVSKDALLLINDEHFVPSLGRRACLWIRIL